jgi:hypothetical protein
MPIKCMTSRKETLVICKRKSISRLWLGQIIADLAPMAVEHEPKVQNPCTSFTAAAYNVWITFIKQNSITY